MICAMPQVHLRDVDLNLLHALQALLAERHVTRAAKRCFLSQPAMSRALERLRRMFGDLLLVRSGRAYERTVRGERVLRELESLMPRLETMVRGEEFDPARSQERFRVAMTDHAAMVLMPPLMERIRAAAANVQIDASAWNDRAYDDVTAGRIDTALSAEAPPPALETEVLYEEDFVCLVGRARRIHTRRFTLKEYLDLPHAIVETWGGATGAGGQALGGTRLEKACRAPPPLLCPDDLHGRAQRPGPHRTPQTRKDRGGDCRGACRGASARGQRLFVFHGLASATHSGS